MQFVSLNYLFFFLKKQDFFLYKNLITFKFILNNINYPEIWNLLLTNSSLVSDKDLLPKEILGLNTFSWSLPVS